MSALARGAVIVTAFPFADGTKLKVRPAAVLAGPWYIGDIAVCWIAMITSSKRTAWPGDVEIADAPRAALPKQSQVRTLKIACIDTRNIIQVIGSLDDSTSRVVASAVHKHLS